jgi:predicted AlkP superfamily phosphohydrolase/phosphomutase
MKLCILGFDALDSQLFEKTELPNLSWIRNNGQWGTLYSPEMRTGPAWTSILTGLTIENHGVTDLLGYPREGSNWFLGRPRDYIFDVLHNAGYSVGVANFPSLPYSREIGKQDHDRSWLIAGWPKAPVIRSSFTYEPNVDLPDDLFSDLPDYERRGLENRKPKGAMEDWAIHELPWEEYIEWATWNAFVRLKFLRKLQNVDVLMVQDSVLDRSGHMLSTPNKGRRGADDSRYREALMLVDVLIGSVIKTWNPDYLSIVSDHGFQGISEANPEKGCWHSHRGTWAICGPSIVPVRNNFNQVHYGHTILDSIGLEFGKEKDGISQLITEDFSGVEDTMRGLGYL